VTVSDLCDEYQNGRINRGAFIRRLMGFGVAMPVAAAYASALIGATAADASSTSGLYNLYGYPAPYNRGTHPTP
jgi:hypothetical protein